MAACQRRPNFAGTLYETLDRDVQMNSPIYSDPANRNPQGSADQAATDFTKTYGVPAEQLNMGTPFYGYDYMDQKELYQNCEPCNDNNVPSLNYGTQIKPWIDKHGWIRKWNWVQDVLYVVRANGGPVFITYDDSISTYTEFIIPYGRADLGVRSSENSQRTTTDNLRDCSRECLRRRWASDAIQAFCRSSEGRSCRAV